MAWSQADYDACLAGIMTGALAKPYSAPAGYEEPEDEDEELEDECEDEDE